MADSDNFRVGSVSVIAHFSHVALDVVGVVVDVLDAAVGQVDGVGALPHACAVVRLTVVEARAGVFICHSVLEAVGRDLGQIIVAMSMVPQRALSDTMANSVANTMSDSMAGPMTNPVSSKTTAPVAPKQLRQGGGGGSQDGDTEKELKHEGH
jgi:hypothetical protein